MKIQPELWEIIWAACSVFAAISALLGSTPMTILFAYLGLSFLFIRKWFGSRHTDAEKEGK